MRQIETSSSVGENNSEPLASSGIGVSLSFSGDEVPALRSPRDASKLTWYAPSESVIQAGLLIEGGMVFCK